MFKCAWCMKKIGDNEPLQAIDVKFAERTDYSNNEGEIIQVFLHSRQTSVPMIVTTADSEAKKNGQDGLFTGCSKPCGKKMKTALTEENDTFQGVSDME